MNQRQIATDIFLAGIESVKPYNLINQIISRDQNILKIEKKTYDLSEIGDIYVVGIGKASAVMAQAIEYILGARITSGHIITKYNHSAPLKFIEITEAGHPVPDENGIKGTKKILSIITGAEKDDLVICVISGGGSALLADVPEGCTLEDLKKVNNILLQTGANIKEINCIRKHLSKVKGGLLAKAASPAKIISLILSDVIDDPIDVIASGPTVPDPTTFKDAISIIRKYKIDNEIPERIYQVLKDGFDGKRQETLKDSDHAFFRINNLIIGNNTIALNNAKKKGELLGYESLIITNQLAGEVDDVANYILEIIRFYKKEQFNKKICLLFAGEPTLKVKGEGLGGRNQHLALILAKLLKDFPGITFLSGGTDGTDGPTDAAGAVVDSSTLLNATRLHINIEDYIRNFDSYNFFKLEKGLIKTGPTQTNVMDLMVALID